MVGRVADRAVQIHGGAGYIADYGVERFYRDVRLFRHLRGHRQIQQIVIARNMMREASDSRPREGRTPIAPGWRTAGCPGASAHIVRLWADDAGRSRRCARATVWSYGELGGHVDRTARAAAASSACGPATG